MDDTASLVSDLRADIGRMRADVHRAFSDLKRFLFLYMLGLSVAQVALIVWLTYVLR